MEELKKYTYTSCLAPFIEGFVSEKRSLGYIYNVDAYELSRFDKFWDENGNHCVDFTREQLQEWLNKKPTESRSYQGRRIRVVRNLAKYMNTLGHQCYVPIEKIGRELPTHHIFTDRELTAFFEQVDSYAPSVYKRMAIIYPVLFRIIYCCGLRNNEACCLSCQDVNLEKGILTIRHGKGNKSRLVYLAEDVRLLCCTYASAMKKSLGYQPFWFFPASDPSLHISKTTVGHTFNRLWAKTKYADSCEKKPTVHSLRHTFVVQRLNQWALSGIDIEVMLPYLCKYLGHKSPEETFYYYHQVDDAFRIIELNDKTAPKVIPEVKRI